MIEYERFNPETTRMQPLIQCIKCRFTFFETRNSKSNVTKCPRCNGLYAKYKLAIDNGWWA